MFPPMNVSKTILGNNVSAKLLPPLREAFIYYNQLVNLTKRTWNNSLKIESSLIGLLNLNTCELHLYIRNIILFKHWAILSFLQKQSLLRKYSGSLLIIA